MLNTTSTYGLERDRMVTSWYNLIWELDTDLWNRRPGVFETPVIIDSYYETQMQKAESDIKAAYEKD